MPSYVTPKRNAAFRFFMGLVDVANPKRLRAFPTLEAGDVIVTVDNLVTAAITTLPVTVPVGSSLLMVSLTAAEMDGDNISINFHDVAGDEWCDLLVTLQTTATQIDELAHESTLQTGLSAIAVDLDQIQASTAAIDLELDSKASAAALGAVAADVDALQVAVQVVDDKVDAVASDVTAIKAKTDNLPSGVQRGVRLNDITVEMVAITEDGTMGMPGLVLLVESARDDGPHVPIHGLVTDIGRGLYRFSLDESETDGAMISVVCTAPGAHMTTLNFTTDPA